jgi:hypothetical protein
MGSILGVARRAMADAGEFLRAHLTSARPRVSA